MSALLKAKVVFVIAGFISMCGACKHRDKSEVSGLVEVSPRSLMDRELWEPAGFSLSGVFPGRSADWLEGGEVWTLPGMRKPRETIVHQGKTRPNHMQFAVKTRENFGAFRLAFDFRFESEDLSQLPSGFIGNSGIYIYGLYEIQIFRAGFFDSRPLIPRGEVSAGIVERTRDGKVLKVPVSQFLCGSVYNTVAPTNSVGDYVNLCADDVQWHHMVIAFKPAKFADGVKQSGAMVKVEIDDTPLTFEGELTYEIPGPTGSQQDKPEVEAGPLVIQDHGSAVSFRGLSIEAF